LSVADVERLLWSDLPRERPVELPFGRPSEIEVAAFANVQLIQRAVRRAQTMSIAVRGDAGPLIRGASTRGLLANVGVDASDRDVVVIDIVGPLTLCHRTAVYGRAIASLVPFLAECSAFELMLTASGPSGAYRSRLSSPVLMPRLPATANTSSAVTTRLARDLRRTMRDVEIVVGPPPVLVGETFVCPDIAIDRGRLYIEIIGFWTASYLERKRTAYARAGLDVLFLVDAERGCVDDEERGDGQRGRAHDALPGNVVPFKRHVDVAALAGWIPMARDYADAAPTRRTMRRR
jgi:predicted nuclease of restriction endonuclease-like RecB superfamily